MKFRYIELGAAILALVSIAAGGFIVENDGKTQPVSEEPIKKVYITKPGEKEYLSPNLIGLQNIAVSNIPITINFINIIDAFREIVNGVRYEILLNGVNTTDNNEEIVCRLIILENPRLSNEFGDKIRILQYSNCTDDKKYGSQKADNLSANIREKYRSNTLFSGSRNKLPLEEITKLESQMLLPAVPKQQIITSTSQSTDSLNMENTYTTDSSGTTDSVSELSNNDKKLLDELLSDGALSVSENNKNKFIYIEGQVQQEKHENHDTKQIENELRSQSRRASNNFYKWQVELDDNDLEKHINNLLIKLASGDGPNYRISNIYSATRQLDTGIFLKIRANLIDDNSGLNNNCTIHILSKSSLETTLLCQNKPKLAHRCRRSLQFNSRNFYQLVNETYVRYKLLFIGFQIKYKKNYQTEFERNTRFKIFINNLKIIQKLNRMEMGSAKYGITEFADMNRIEYKQRTGLWQGKKYFLRNDRAIIPEVDLPKEFDWREKGVISPVKNQENCGSCWAFSVTGNIEGIHAVKTGRLEEYSEQELLDCDAVDSACNGGLPDNAYEAIVKIGGLELESEYPYVARKGPCQFNKNLIHVKVKGAVDLPKNETAMALWLFRNGPISIGVNANAMQFYRGGISHPWKSLCSHKNLDHGVLIVGYGVSDYPMFKKTLPYWIIKNSWGSKWGEQGYYRVYRGDNTCGVAEMASSAVLADD